MNPSATELTTSRRRREAAALTQGALKKTHSRRETTRLGCAAMRSFSIVATVALLASCNHATG
ncbi:MAG: hypothetical protein ACXVDD_10435, partial [Polyangia bacterium]